MRKVKYILSFVLSTVMLLSMVSCKKETSETTSHDPNKLPPLTHEGKNTFGCLVNGEVWVAYAPFTVGGTIAIEGAYHSNVEGLYIRASRKNNELNISESIDFAVIDLNSVGLHQTYSNHHLTKGFIDFKDKYNCSIYYYDTTLVRTINITYFSLVKGIVSGTFAMDLVNPSCLGDTIRIREGRFDWRMVIYN